MDYEDLKLAPDKTGWYITIFEKTMTDEDYYYDGPYHDKASAISELRDMIKSNLPSNLIEYKVEYYNVSIAIDKNAGSWVPKREDYAKD